MNEEIAKKLTKIEQFISQDGFFDCFYKVEPSDIKGVMKTDVEVWLGYSRVVGISESYPFDIQISSVYERARLIELLQKFDCEVIEIAFGETKSDDKPLMMRNPLRDDIVLSMGSRVEEEEDE